MMTRPHAFVAMPFGVKPGPDNQPIDFNRVYGEYIAPALDAAGLQAFRADEEIRAGDIRTDMFQELLIADLVVADLTIDNPNVWYELGVRHALRTRGVVLISSGRVTTAFDLYTDRKLRYGLKGGGPDPATIEEDKRKLTAIVGTKRRDGRLLGQHQHIADPARPARQFEAIFPLRVLFPEFADVSDAEHLPCRLLQVRHLEQGLEIEPENLNALREKGICLQRLAITGLPGHSLDRARQHYGDAWIKAGESLRKVERFRFAVEQ